MEELLNVSLSNLLFSLALKSKKPFVSKSRYISWSLSELRSIELILLNFSLLKLWLLSYRSLLSVKSIYALILLKGNEFMIPSKRRIFELFWDISISKLLASIIIASLLIFNLYS